MMVLSQLLAQNAETQKAVLRTVDRLSDAAKQQGEVLAKYLELFKSPEPPRRWTRNIERENIEFLAREGYPVEATAEEQARWLAEHIDD